MKLKIILVFALLIFCKLSSQNSTQTIDDKNFANSLLKYAMNLDADTISFDNPIITTEKEAIKYAEFSLFKIYGKETIESQKPYRIHLIDEHWILYGVLPENYRGGVFKIVIDSRNGKILLIEHGK